MANNSGVAFSLLFGIFNGGYIVQITSCLIYFRSYGASKTCVDSFLQNCQIAKEFFEKTMATPKMLRFYTHLCNTGKYQTYKK